MPSVAANTARPSVGWGCTTGCAADAETRGIGLEPLILCDLAPRSRDSAASTRRGSTTSGANECPWLLPTRRGRARGEGVQLAVQPTRGNARKRFVPARTHRVGFRRSPLSPRCTFGAPLAILVLVRSVGRTLALQHIGYMYYCV